MLISRSHDILLLTPDLVGRVEGWNPTLIIASLPQSCAIAQSSHVWFYITWWFTSKDLTDPTQPTARGERTRSCGALTYSPANDPRCIGTVGCNIRLILDKTDVGDGIVLSSRCNGYPRSKGIIQHICGWIHSYIFLASNKCANSNNWWK